MTNKTRVWFFLALQTCGVSVQAVESTHEVSQSGLVDKINHKLLLLNIIISDAPREHYHDVLLTLARSCKKISSIKKTVKGVIFSIIYTSSTDEHFENLQWQAMILRDALNQARAKTMQAQSHVVPLLSKPENEERSCVEPNAACEEESKHVAKIRRMIQLLDQLPISSTPKDLGTAITIIIQCCKDIPSMQNKIALLQTIVASSSDATSSQEKAQLLTDAIETLRNTLNKAIAKEIQKQNESSAEEEEEDEEEKKEEEKKEEEQKEETKERPRFAQNADRDMRSQHVEKMRNIIRSLDQLSLNNTREDRGTAVNSKILSCKDIPSMQEAIQVLQEMMANNNDATSPQEKAQSLTNTIETFRDVLNREIAEAMKKQQGVSSEEEQEEQRERQPLFHIDDCMAWLDMAYTHCSSREDKTNNANTQKKHTIKNVDCCNKIREIVYERLSHCTLVPQEKARLIKIRENLGKNPNNALTSYEVTEVIQIMHDIQATIAHKGRLLRSSQQEPKQFDTHVRREAHIVSPQAFSAPAHQSLASGQRAQQNLAITQDLRQRHLAVKTNPNAYFTALSPQEQQNGLQSVTRVLNTREQSFNPGTQSVSWGSNPLQTGAMPYFPSIQPMQASHPQAYPMASGPHMAQTASRHVTAVNQSPTDRAKDANLTRVLNTHEQSFNPGTQSVSWGSNPLQTGAMPYFPSIQPMQASHPQAYPMASGPHMAQTASRHVTAVNQSPADRPKDTNLTRVLNTREQSFNPGTQSVSWGSNPLQTDAMPYFPSVEPNQVFNGFTAREPQDYPMASGPHTAQTASRHVTAVNQPPADRPKDANLTRVLNTREQSFNPGTQSVSWGPNPLQTGAMPYFPSIQPMQASTVFTAREPQAYPMASGPHTAQTASRHVTAVNQPPADRAKDASFYPLDLQPQEMLDPVQATMAELRMIVEEHKDTLNHQDRTGEAVAIGGMAYQSLIQQLNSLATRVQPDKQLELVLISSDLEETKEDFTTNNNGYAFKKCDEIIDWLKSNIQ